MSEMHSVLRIEIPRSLKEHSDEWKNELLEQIELVGCYAKVDKKYKDKYRQPDVQEAVHEMYRGCCCYCESLCENVSYDIIEHLKPKAVFPELSFDWDNLHYVCPKCNGNKLNRWDAENPILNPTKDEISDYLSINLVTGEIESINDNPRGQTTIEHTQLNRKELVSKRRKIVLLLLKKFKFCNNPSKSTIDDVYEISDLLGFYTLVKTLIQQIRT